MRKTRILLCLAAALLLGACQSAPQKLTKEGLGLYESGQYQGALDKFDAALRYDFLNAERNYYAGNSAFKLARYETAGYYYKLAWQADPGIPEVKDALTETLLRVGKEQEALDFLERDAALTSQVKDPRWKRVDTKRPYVWETEERMFLGHAGDRLRVAMTYERIGDLDNARLNFEKAREMAPGSAIVLKELGEFYCRIKQKAAGVDALRKAYQIDPKTPGLIDALTRNNIAISEL